MSPQVEILDAGSIGQLSKLADPSDWASRYLRPLVVEGASAYVENANVKIRALVVEGRVLPLVINPGVERCGGICSPYAHYVAYSLEEFEKRHAFLPPRLWDLLASPFSMALRAGRIDRVVYVNNWLFATNPSPALSSPQIGAVISLLSRIYPDFALVFRSVNPRIDGQGSRMFQAHGFRFVRSRRVYILDPTDGGYLEHKNAVRDLALLDRTSYEVMGGPALEPHVERLAHLYRDLYLVKHSSLNPQFNARFFSLTLEKETFVYRALRRGGTIDAFAAWFVQDGVMTGAVLGYDREQPRKIKLLPLLFAIMIREAIEKRLLLNLSAGVGPFKMLRGARPAEEFDAVFDRHLSLPRRLAWTGLGVAASVASRRSATRGDAVQVCPPPADQSARALQ